MTNRRGKNKLGDKFPKQTILTKSLELTISYSGISNLDLAEKLDISTNALREQIGTKRKKQLRSPQLHVVDAILEILESTKSGSRLFFILVSGGVDPSLAAAEAKKSADYTANSAKVAEQITESIAEKFEFQVALERKLKEISPEQCLEDLLSESEVLTLFLKALNRYPKLGLKFVGKLTQDKAFDLFSLLILKPDFITFIDTQEIHPAFATSLARIAFKRGANLYHIGQELNDEDFGKICGGYGDSIPEKKPSDVRSLEDRLIKPETKIKNESSASNSLSD